MYIKMIPRENTLTECWYYLTLLQEIQKVQEENGD